MGNNWLSASYDSDRSSTCIFTSELIVSSLDRRATEAQLASSDWYLLSSRGNLEAVKQTKQ